MANRTATRSAPQPDTGRRPIIVIAIVVGVAVVVAAIIAIAATGGSGSDTEGLSQTQDVQVSGAALVPYLDEIDDPAVGQNAPIVSGSDFDGTPVRVEIGQPTLLVYLAHWCPACQAEVPELVAWEAAGLVPEGVQVIGIATGTDSGQPNYPPSSWLESEGWPFPVLVDDSAGTAAAAYGLTATPYYVMLDADGRVVARGSGQSSIEQLTALAESALAA